MINGLGLIQPNTMEENMSNLTSASGEASVSSINRNENSGISQQPIKKKRNQPGHPDPGAEVVALSPRTLVTTNRFVCDVCNKGFQRDQNLQLHRRGHNLPWKLKQKPKNGVGRRRVYVCPEIGCVHHDPSRALGDLTGIKKHFFRKHGEKKWKCDKCSKKYAVRSDWKAHSKICGTKEYKCDCGTTFSRRDSFITHRAFCDALAQNSVDNTNTLPFQIKRDQNLILKQEIPPWLSSSPIIGATLAPPPPPIELILQDFHQNQDFRQTHHHQNPNPNPSLGATSLPPYHHHPPFPDHVSFGPSRDQLGAPSPLAQEMMTMMMNNAGLGLDDVVLGHANEGKNSTRDFLGLRPLSQNEILSITGLDSGHETSKSWQG